MISLPKSVCCIEPHVFENIFQCNGKANSWEFSIYSYCLEKNSYLSAILLYYLKKGS